MIKKELSAATEELYHLQNCKLAMGEYYQHLVDRFPAEERLFWESAISDEVNHARLIGRLIALVTANPSAAKPGKFRVAVLETFLVGIYEQIDLINRGSLTPTEMLKIAYDYESSAIMMRPQEIIESLDPKFQELRKRLSEDVNEHTNRLKQYLGQKLGLNNKTSHIKLQNPVGNQPGL